MDIYVVSIDDTRWEQCADALVALDLSPIHVPGVLESDVPEQAVEMLRTKRPRKRAAIRFAMQNAARIAAGRGVIIQDDTRFTHRPEWDSFEMVTYAAPLPGWHHCPRAFAVPTRLRDLLVSAWNNWSLNACAGWRPILDDDCTIRPSIIEEQVWR